jgi:hypothetical protein
MAFTVTPQTSPIGANLVESSLTTALETVSSGSTTFYYIDIDNTFNASDVHLKMFDGTSADLEGVPEMALKCAASRREVASFPAGITFAVGLTIAMTDGAGFGVTTGPTNAVTVRILTSPAD